MSRFCASLVILTLWSQIPVALRAQSNTPAGRLEVSGGASWTGGISFTTHAALEEDRSGDPYLLFSAASELQPVAVYDVRIGLRLIGRFELETGLSYSKPELVVRVSSDVEGAEAARIAETISQLQVDAGILAPLTSWRPGQRNIPFIAAGAGYLRELHEEQTLLVDGRSYYLGGGMKRILTIRQSSWVKAAGVRVDGRLVARRKGVAFDSRTRLASSFGASLFVRF